MYDSCNNTQQTDSKWRKPVLTSRLFGFARPNMTGAFMVLDGLNDKKMVQSSAYSHFDERSDINYLLHFIFIPPPSPLSSILLFHSKNIVFLFQWNDIFSKDVSSIRKANKYVTNSLTRFNKQFFLFSGKNFCGRKGGGDYNRILFIYCILLEIIYLLLIYYIISFIYFRLNFQILIFDPSIQFHSKLTYVES